MIKKLYNSKFIRFCGVGVINTLVGSGVMFALYNLAGCGYWISSAANYIVGSIVSFFLNKYFTFQNTEKSARQVVIFALNIVVCYLIAYSAARPIIHTLFASLSVNWADNISMLCGLFIFTLLNFFGQKLIVFKIVE